MIKKQRGSYSSSNFGERKLTETRGANVKAMAICTRHSFLHIYKPILLLALEEYFKQPTTETLAGLFTAVNDMDLSAMPKLSVFERQILAASDNKDMFCEKFEEMAERIAPSVTSPTVQMRSPSSLGGAAGEGDADRRGAGATYINLGRAGGNMVMNGKISLNRDTHEFETKVVYNSIPVPIRVPVAVMPETVGDVLILPLRRSFVFGMLTRTKVLSDPTDKHVLGPTHRSTAAVRPAPSSHNQWALHTPNHSTNQWPSYREESRLPQP